MRRVFNGSVVVVILALAGSALAGPREVKEKARDRESGVVKMVRTIVRSLGDGLIVPIPKPTPTPQP